MPSCLGLYIEDNLIKYAKVSKNNEMVKIESFGVKFFENMETTLKQIVEETYSFKVPISINATDEWYNDVNVFSLLTKKDMEKSVKTEFESICYEQEKNDNTFEQRIVYANANGTADKIKIIDIAVPKTTIEYKKNQFSRYKLNSIVPLSVSIANLIKKEKKSNVLIVNIEKETVITGVTNGIISDIEVMNIGSQEILEKINKKENSYSKSYNICKNSTIYTEKDGNIVYEENEYLEDIMPTLFNVVSQVRKKIENSLERIDRVYITGTGALINNIDIYFQDYLGIDCEILKPSFINNNSKINIKDYIEVNSAIAIGMQGLEKNNKDINFMGETGVNQFLSLLNSNISDIGQNDVARAAKDILGRFNKQINLLSMTFIMVTILYFVGIITLNNQLDEKIKEADLSIVSTNDRIKTIQQYERDFNSQTSKYRGLINNIQNINNTNSEDRRYRNTIPNLLNSIMSVIPKGVHLTLIQNTSDNHIVITAKAEDTQQIAFFKTKLQEEEILKNVISDPGKSVVEHIQDNNGMSMEVTFLVVTIEGEMP